MRLLPTFLIALATLALGTLVVVQQVSGNLDFIFGSSAKKIGQVVYTIDPNTVKRIHIQNQDGTEAVLIKSGNAWKLSKPWHDDADARIVRSLIQFASRLQIEDVIARNDVADLADYGLKRSQIGVQLFDENGSSLCHFKIGRNTAWRGFDPSEKLEPGEQPSSFPTLIIHPNEKELSDHLYVCTDIADPNIRRVGIRTLFDGALRLFRGRQVFYNTPLLSSEITLKEKNSEIYLTRTAPDQTTPWRISKPFDLATNPESIAKLIQGLARMEADLVLDESALSLPEASPENIDFEVSLTYFMPDGQKSAPVTASFYPPENEQSRFVYAVVVDAGEKRPAVLRIPRTSDSPLGYLPKTVNELRSKTLTSLSVREIQGIDLSDDDGKSVQLSLEMDPHERAPRWHVVAGEYTGTEGLFQKQYMGPASEFQTSTLFESLFKDEIISFTNDATTEPSKYGLDQPIRRISVKLNQNQEVRYIIGEKQQPHYYARRADGGRPLQISKDAYDAGVKGQTHRELLILPPIDANGPFQGDLSLLGLDKPTISRIPYSNGQLEIHLSAQPSLHFYANRLDRDGNTTAHVVEIPADSISKMGLEAFRWRSNRLWNISRFDIKGLTIKRQDAPPLELEYNFYTQIWRATSEGKDVTSLLNPHKAEKLLKKLTDIQVQHWLGPQNQNANHRLATPTLELSLLVEEVNDDGERLGLTPQVLKLSQIVPNVPNKLYYGQTSQNPNYFLVDVATVRSLAVKLLEEE